MTREQALEEALTEAVDWIDDVCIEGSGYETPDGTAIVKRINAALATPESVCRWTPLRGGMVFVCSCDGRQRGTPFISDNWDVAVAEYETDHYCSGCGARIEIVEGE